MSYPLTDLLLVTVCFIFAIIMIVEAIIILRSKKPIVPIPSQILYWISTRFSSNEKTTQRFAGKNTPENVRTYAKMDLISGIALFIACAFYLNWMLSH